MLAKSLRFDSVAEVQQKRSQTALGDVVVFEELTERRIPERSRQARSEGLSCTRVVAKAEVASDDVLEETNGARLLDSGYHVGQDRANGIEALVSLAHVRETDVVEEDLLYDEDGDGLTKLGTSLHDSKAQRDDLCAEEKSDDLRVVRLFDQSSDHSERCETQVLKGTGLGCGVEKRVEEQRDVGC